MIQSIFVFKHVWRGYLVKLAITRVTSYGKKTSISVLEHHFHHRTVNLIREPTPKNVFTALLTYNYFLFKKSMKSAGVFELSTLTV